MPGRVLLPDLPDLLFLFLLLLLLFLLRLAGGEIVDIQIDLRGVVFAFEGERAAGGFERDRPARAIRILLFLIRSAALRLRVGTEISAAWRGRRGRVEPRAAERRGRTRTEAARARTGRTAGPGAAGATIFTRASFADGQQPSVEDLAVEPLNRVFGVRAVGKLDER